MVVTNRKVVSGDPHTLSPIPRSSVVGRSINNNNLKQTFPPEYMEAINVLSESNMHQSCEILLLEDDDAASSAKKLLETYHRCQSAVSILQKQTFPVAAPILTGSSIAAATTASSGIAARSSLSKKHSIINSKHGVVPMRGRKPQLQRRDRSDSADKSELPSSKKARLQALASKDSKSSPSDGPPPNALNFLAKLNKGDTPTPSATKRKPNRMVNRRGSA